MVDRVFKITQHDRALSAMPLPHRPFTIIHTRPSHDLCTSAYFIPPDTLPALWSDKAYNLFFRTRLWNLPLSCNARLCPMFPQHMVLCSVPECLILCEVLDLFLFLLLCWLRMWWWDHISFTCTLLLRASSVYSPCENPGDVWWRNALHILFTNTS